MRGKNVISSWAGFIFIEYTRQIWYFYVDVLFHLFASSILHTPVGSGEVEQSIVFVIITNYSRTDTADTSFLYQKLKGVFFKNDEAETD